MLVATDLRKQFGDVAALNGLSLRVEPGEVVGLIGHNGAGKSTFVEVVMGLVAADTGTITIGGVDARSHPGLARSLIGFSPQELALYLPATARENLELFGGLAGRERRAVRREVSGLLAELDLEGVANQQVRFLSGGQQRRVQAGCALIGEPDLLLLDEPTVGADPSTRQMLLEAVRRRAAAGAAVLYTTHYLPELVDLEATLAVVRAGRVIARGSQQDLLARLPGEVLLRFDGQVPERARQIARTPKPQVSADELRVPALDPSARLPQLLAELAAANSVPIAVEVQKPSLDDLYQSLERPKAAA